MTSLAAFLAQVLPLGQRTRRALDETVADWACEARAASSLWQRAVVAGRAVVAMTRMLVFAAAARVADRVNGRSPALPTPPPPGVAMRFDALVREIRIGIRRLLRQPGFAVASVATLALGIGANTAVFSVVQHVLVTPLPYANPDGVAVIWNKWRGFDKTWVSDAEVVDYRTRVGAFAELGAWSVTQVNVTGDGDPVRVGAAFVTPDVFTVLGTPPIVGRTFTASDAQATTSSVVVLGYGIWQQRFGGAAVIGRTVRINGSAREIVGVMPRGFQLPTDYVQDAAEPTQLWLPYRLEEMNRNSHGLHAVARLRGDVTIARANEELAAVTRQLTSEGKYPEPMQFSAFALSATDEAVASVRPALLLVFGAVACLLLIACANVANLLLVRSEGRIREMAVRSALGASRRALVRQLVIEASILAAAAACAGIACAWAMLRMVVATDATSLPRVDAVALDWRTLTFGVAVSAATFLLFALVPAWRASRVDLVESLKDGSQNSSASERRQRLRGGLIVAETAVALVLVTGAGLMLRTVWNLQRVDLGFDPHRVLTMRLALPADGYETPEAVNTFYADVLSRVRALPGVERAGLLRALPLATQIGDWSLTIEGRAPTPGVSTPGDWQVATAGGAESLGERLLAGRWLTDSDTATSANVVLVNDAMAKAYWPGQDPLGRRVRMGGPTRPWATVVGIVGNVRHNGVTTAIKPKFYRPLTQFHLSSGGPVRNMTLVVRTAGDPIALAPAVAAEVRTLDRDLPIAAVRSMDDVVKTSIVTPRLTGALLLTFALLALALAALGIYSVLSYVVAARRQEIGIRLAIGAAPSRVVRLVIRQGVGYAAAGALVGLVASGLTSRLLASLLHGVEPLDPATFIAAPALLVAVAVRASLVPAWRATRVDPLNAMRVD